MMKIMTTHAAEVHSSDRAMIMQDETQERAAQVEERREDPDAEHIVAQVAAQRSLNGRNRTCVVCRRARFRVSG